MSNATSSVNLMSATAPMSFSEVCRQAAFQASDSMTDALVQQQAAEGATLRAAAAFVAYPLDVLKTQVQAGHPQYNRLLKLPNIVKDYRMNILKGYPGVGVNAFIMGGLMFGGYRFFDNFWQLNGVPDYWRPAVAGASIGMICGVVATPLEQVKTVMALQEAWLKEGKITQRIYPSVVQGALNAPAKLKFYAAMPLMIRTGLFDCQLFFYNSRLRDWLATSGSDISPSSRLAISTFGFMTAGLIGATVNYPFDLVKGRMMAEAYEASTGVKTPSTMIGTFRKVIADGGVAGLFRGLPTRSALHATVWCVVGIGREVCERVGVRDGARKRSAEQGHSKNLSA
ncbi:unnamed protein product [Polarella glacialis]|uniref:Mitochondrial carrier protein n=1 Tax=Polarella glacialis TaxID=89957 RepID=A0A813DVD1_POLGL|nr:unnamed protein product [Polarella glacialis]